MSDNKLTDMARKLRELKDKKQIMEDDLDIVNHDIKELETQLLPTYMTDNDIDKISIDGVGTVYLNRDVFVHVRAEDRDKLHQWLRDDGNGDVIKEQVAPQTLKALAKARLTEGKALPDFIQAAFVETARIRRA